VKAPSDAVPVKQAPQDLPFSIAFMLMRTVLLFFSKSFG